VCPNFVSGTGLLRECLWSGFHAKKKIATILAMMSI
jgi:hypothetical protein